MEFLIMHHPLTDFGIQRYQMQPKFKGAYSRSNLPGTLKDGTCIVNLDDYKSIGSHWTALYVNGNSMTYLDSFGVSQKKLKGN